MPVHTLKEINKIPLKEAETNKEKQLLGLIDKEAKDIQYGKIELDITINGGNIVNVAVVKIKKNIKFN